LAGVEGRVVTDAEQAAEALREVARASDVGVVIIVDAIAAEVREQVDAIRLESERPLLVEIPGPTGPLPGRKTLRQLVQEAVGIRISQEEEGA
jgi:V/A-type H+/Na+-transporting ATPase subunit F